MYSRLFVPIFFIIAMVVGVRYHLLLESETTYANARYQHDAGELSAHLRKTLLPLLAVPDRAGLEAALSSALLLNADLRAARLDYAGGHLEALRSQPAEAQYAPWFTRLVPINPVQRTLNLDHATLALSFEPVQPLNGVWRNVHQQAVISAANVGIIYTLLGLIIFANKRMLRRLADATNRFQGGEHDVRLPVSGTLEARMLASTFNNMAQRVQALVHKLQQSQNDLSAQLARTLLAQQQLQVEKDRIEVTLASIGDAVITTDLNGKIDTINEVAQSLTGWPESRARHAAASGVCAGE